MLRTKPLLFFIIKAAVIYILLAAPVSFFDDVYGKIYRKCATTLFHRFHGKGFAQFTEGEYKAIIRVNVGNLDQVRKNNTAPTTYGYLNIRYLGYLPTILLITLILASPVTWKRKAMALILGLLLLNAIIIMEQWLHLMFLSIRATWLNLVYFSETKKNIINLAYNYLVRMQGISRFLVVLIWLLVTFRKADLKILIRPSGNVNAKQKATSRNFLKRN